MRQTRLKAGCAALIATFGAVSAVLASGDIRPATAVELFDRFSNTTQILDDGVAYYSSAGVLLLVENKKLVSGKWTTDDTGVLCWVRGEPEVRDCGAFVMYDGIVFRFEDGAIRGQPDLQPGNLLAEAASAQAYAESAKLFTPEETVAFLSGKTAKRSAVGRMYYAPDMALKTVWNGVHKTGRWSVDEQGGVCWHVTGWGEQPCEYYYIGQKETVWSRFRGLDKVAPEHVEGDLTGEM